MTSSSISSIGYDAGAQMLEVEFHSGRVYQYHGVPERVHAELLGAPSIGGYFNSRIRPSYPYRPLGGPVRAPAAPAPTGSQPRT